MDAVSRDSQTVDQSDPSTVLRQRVLFCHLPELGGVVRELAIQFHADLELRWRGASFDASWFLCILGRLVLQPVPDGARLSDRLDAVLFLVAKTAGAAPGIQTSRGLSDLSSPVYLSFLGLVWFTPQMSLDHAVLTAVWTIYIFYGSMLKDRRLVHYLGNVYRHYAADVPGYPLVTAGPLGRWKLGDKPESPKT